MKVCFVGLGSIAIRHIKNLKKIFGQEMIITILRSGKGRSVPDNILELVDCVISSEDGLTEQYDAIFITNPTCLHYFSLKMYHQYSNAFFIEKPVFLLGTEDIEVFDRNKIYYVACPLRYTKVIQYLKENVDFTRVYSLRCISSSYLPEWRPGQDYRNAYSAHKEMGGGVSIDLVHEWDYIRYLIGDPICIHNIIAKKSSLEIDSDDIALYIAEYIDKTVEIHLDYFGRYPMRQLELYMEEDTIICDLIAHKVQWLKKDKIIDLGEERDEYQLRELTHFIKIIYGKENNNNDLAFACQTLRFARGIV